MCAPHFLFQLRVWDITILGSLLRTPGLVLKEATHRFEGDGVNRELEVKMK